MPRRRRYGRRRRRVGRRRRGFRRRGRKSVGMRISMRRMPALFPDCALITFKYCERVSFTLVQNVLSTVTYRMNSLYDPQYAIGGGQPMGFDQWANFYNCYMVYATAIKVEAISNASTPLELIIGPDNDSSPPANATQASELPLHRRKVVNTGYAQQTTLSARWSVKKLEGRRLGSEDDYGALFSASPVKEKYIHVMLNQSLSTTDVPVEMRITLWFKSRLYRRKTTLAQS